MRYFVIMGNTRVGSTWFSASMHDLPGVFCTREIRWRMPYQDQSPPVHTYVDSTTRSIKERLEFGCRVAGKRDLAALGAKLKFDPYGYAPPSAFSDLGKIIEDDVHVVFLWRSYFEIFQTWKGFGIRHLANPNARKARSKKKNGGEPDFDGERLSRFHTMHSVPLAPKKVFITGDGNVFARSLHNRYSGSDTLYYSISDAIDDLLVLFYNDVFALTVIAGHDNVDIFSYQDIRSRFFGVTQKLSLSVSAEDCRDVLDNAATCRIEPPGLKLVFPDDALQEISRHLDSLFHRIRRGESSTDSVVQCDEQEGTVSFHLPELPSIFAKHEETAGLLRSGASGSSRFLHRALAPARRVERRYSSTLRRLRSLFAMKTRVENEHWRAQRPMYVPLALAPAATVAPTAKQVVTRS